LSSNDATAAFSSLVESQEIESKAEKFEGSAPEEPEEKEPPKKKAV